MASKRGPYKKPHGGTCSIEGCEQPWRTKSWCAMHYARWRRTGDPLASRLDRQHDGRCSVDGCTDPYEGKGLCKNHRRQKTYRDKPVLALAEYTKPRVSMGGGKVFTISVKDFRRVFAGPCLACGSRDGLEFEHLIPIERGGDHSVGNLARLCRACNASKGSQTWMEWRLSSKPRALALFRGEVA